MRDTLAKDGSGLLLVSDGSREDRLVLRDGSDVQGAGCHVPGDLEVPKLPGRTAQRL